MFVAVQIPLADLRHFVAEDTGRLPAPPWPLADPARHFVRAVGPIRRRKRGGVPEWIGESLYCDARRAVVFPPGSGCVEHQSAGTYLTPMYRRFRATGRAQWPGAVARIDVGFKVNRRTPGGRVTGRMLPGPKDAALAAATVLVSVPPDSRIRTLVESRQALAAKIHQVTTSLTKPPAHAQAWWVQPGTPLVMVEAPATGGMLAAVDPPIDPDEVAAVAHDALALHHLSYVEWRQYRVPVWTLFYDRNIGADVLRRLRIHLWRLHNEREVLRLVLAECLQRRIDLSQPALRDYLARQSSGLRQAERDGFPQADLLRQAYALDQLVDPGDLDTLRQILQDMSRGVAASVLPLAQSSPDVPARVIYINQAHIGALIGDHASIAGSMFQGSGTQYGTILDEVDLPQLAEQLQLLAGALSTRASTFSEHMDVEYVREAATATQQGDKRSAWAQLRNAGKWVLDVAKDIGAEIAAKVIMKAFGQ
jgi:hypothetical protein